jgi:hypothetical protein
MSKPFVSTPNVHDIACMYDGETAETVSMIPTDIFLSEDMADWIGEITQYLLLRHQMKILLEFPLCQRNNARLEHL